MRTRVQEQMMALVKQRGLANQLSHLCRKLCEARYLMCNPKSVSSDHIERFLGLTLWILRDNATASFLSILIASAQATFILFRLRFVITRSQWLIM